MRTVLLIAASALVAGCSSGSGGSADQTGPTPTSPTASSSSSNSSSTRATATTTGTPGLPPSPGAAIADVVQWVEAGRPVDASAFHSATRVGTATDLGDDVAFTSGDSNCMTDSRFAGALACLVNLSDPPPQPAEVYGQWKGNWVDFEGPTAEVGSAHGDPGRFGNGTGPQLTPGQSLAFGDYRCRADATDVFCVNYAHQTALEFSRAGIEPFGCLAKATPPGDIGVKFSC